MDEPVVVTDDRTDNRMILGRENRRFVSMFTYTCRYKHLLENQTK